MSNQPPAREAECFGCTYRVPDRAAFVLEIDWRKWVCLLGLADHDKPPANTCTKFDDQPF